MAEAADTVSDALEALDDPNADEVYFATMDFPVREIASEAAKRALSGGGVGVLEDSGNAWEPSTAVTQGYRIVETVDGEQRVFEATTAGTTASWPASFIELEPNISPFGLTSERWSASDAWWIPAARVPTAGPVWSNFVRDRL